MRSVPLLDNGGCHRRRDERRALRIDQIVTRVDEVSERVSDTSRVAPEVANAPAEIVNDSCRSRSASMEDPKQPHAVRQRRAGR